MIDLYQTCFNMRRAGLSYVWPKTGTVFAQDPYYDTVADLRKGALNSFLYPYESVDVHSAPWAILLTWNDVWKAYTAAKERENGNWLDDGYLSSVFYSSEAGLYQVKTLWSSLHVAAYTQLVNKFQAQLKQGLRPKMFNH